MLGFVCFSPAEVCGFYFWQHAWLLALIRHPNGENGMMERMGKKAVAPVSHSRGRKGGEREAAEVILLSPRDNVKGGAFVQRIQWQWWRSPWDKMVVAMLR